MRDAAANAKRNHLATPNFTRGDAGEFMRQMQEAGEKLDVLFMDPPRAGSSRTFLKRCGAGAAAGGVYLLQPGNPGPGHRLSGSEGLRVQAIQPVDMFPHTNHVETVVLFVQT